MTTTILIAIAAFLVITLVLGAAFLWEAPVWLDADQAVKEAQLEAKKKVMIYMLLLT